MNKKIIGISIILIVVTVGFSGCIDLNLDESFIKMSIYSFNIEPDIIELGETAKLNWAVIGADTVSIDNEIGVVSLTGDTVIQPTKTTTYVLTATNKTKSITANTKIIVNELTDEKYISLSDGTKVYGDFDKVEIINYTAFTDREIDYWEYVTITDGLVYSEEASRYRLNVTVKNIANELLDRIYVYVYFYDNQGNRLYSDENGCKELHMNDTCIVELDWYDYFSSSYFEHMEYIEFEVYGYQI